MNTSSTDEATVVARVAVDVRLYFDVPVTRADDEAEIRLAARAELERVANEERIQVKLLHYPALYPCDDWPALKPRDFTVCDICPAGEVISETRYPL